MQLAESDVCMTSFAEGSVALAACGESAPSWRGVWYWDTRGVSLEPSGDGYLPTVLGLPDNAMVCLLFQHPRSLGRTVRVCTLRYVGPR
jgi:hypothetical protein